MHAWMTRYARRAKSPGYYEPTIDFDLAHRQKGRQVLIAASRRVSRAIGGTNVVLRGGARTDRDYSGSAQYAALKSVPY